MIHTLITGKLVKDPVVKNAQNGKQFTNCLIAVNADGENVLISGIAFGDVAERIAKLKKSDAVSVTGHLKPTEYQSASGETRYGLSITISQVLTAYDIKKRKPLTQENQRPTDNGRPFNDDINF